MTEEKHFNVKLSKEIWLFIKKIAAQKEVPMQKIVRDALEKYKKNIEKKC